MGGLTLAAVLAAAGSAGGVGDFLTPLLGIAGTGITVVGAVVYIVKFQSTFTSKLEERDKENRGRIAKLERRVDYAEASERRCQARLGRVIYLLNENGIDYTEPAFPVEDILQAPEHEDEGT